MALTSEAFEEATTRSRQARTISAYSQYRPYVDCYIQRAVAVAR